MNASLSFEAARIHTDDLRRDALRRVRPDHAPRRRRLRILRRADG